VVHGSVPGATRAVGELFCGGQHKDEDSHRSHAAPIKDSDADANSHTDSIENSDIESSSHALPNALPHSFRVKNQITHGNTIDDAYAVLDKVRDAVSYANCDSQPHCQHTYRFAHVVAISEPIRDCDRYCFGDCNAEFHAVHVDVQLAVLDKDGDTVAYADHDSQPHCGDEPKSHCQHTYHFAHVVAVGEPIRDFNGYCFWDCNAEFHAVHVDVQLALTDCIRIIFEDSVTLHERLDVRVLVVVDVNFRHRQRFVVAHADRDPIGLEQWLS
jgi:hypothetical protein